MARFLTLWRLNMSAPWPMDPSKALELNEKMWAAMDDSMKKGLVKDYGVFPDGTAGYLIGEGDAINVFRGANMYMPYILCETHEIIPYEKEKEIIRALLKAQIAAAAKK